MVWHYSSFRVTSGGSIEEAISSLSKDIRNCPVCEGVVSAIEYATCELLRKVKPDLDPDFCRKMLRSRLEGKSPEEIARELGVDVEILREAIDVASEMVKEAYEEALGKKKRRRKK